MVQIDAVSINIAPGAFDGGSGAGGGRLFHLDYDPRYGWHVNADVGVFRRYNHMSPTEAIWTLLSDTAASMTSVTIPFPPILPQGIFAPLNPYAPSSPVMD